MKSYFAMLIFVLMAIGGFWCQGAPTSGDAVVDPNNPTVTPSASDDQSVIPPADDPNKDDLNVGDANEPKPEGTDDTTVTKPAETVIQAESTTPTATADPQTPTVTPTGPNDKPDTTPVNSVVDPNDASSGSNGDDSDDDDSGDAEAVVPDKCEDIVTPSKSGDQDDKEIEDLDPCRYYDFSIDDRCHNFAKTKTVKDEARDHCRDVAEVNDADKQTALTNQLESASRTESFWADVPEGATGLKWCDGATPMTGFVLLKPEGCLMSPASDDERHFAICVKNPVDMTKQAGPVLVCGDDGEFSIGKACYEIGVGGESYTNALTECSKSLVTVDSAAKQSELEDKVPQSSTHEFTTTSYWAVVPEDATGLTWCDGATPTTGKAFLQAETFCLSSPTGAAAETHVAICQFE